MEQLYEYRARLARQLERQPAELADAIAAIPDVEWTRRRGLDGRTLHQVASHVRDLEVRAYLPRLRRVLAEDEPALEAYPSHNWTDATYDPAKSMTEILTDFARAREEALQLLRPLAPDDWSRLGFHPPSGRRTLQWWVEQMWVHAAEHREEIITAR